MRGKRGSDERNPRYWLTPKPFDYRAFGSIGCQQQVFLLVAIAKAMTIPNFTFTPGCVGKTPSTLHADPIFLAASVFCCGL
ncbi:hypothetical protein MPNT_150005 [Candidatus Methylacidithermus pantelleriae]|uniref:Uncharacterized protein n=1 Tax=Candidatus Methylacidithermus pantelleriae TaxID=2744239 RepID=A0A8J2BMS9_9BACT|nr:hypothetical protein MPNT_150005 [Candidatus Methylacidithermus pantelleriae]